MKDTIDFLYMQKKLSNEWVHLIPSEEERLAHEKFDDTLTKEQRILLREYERQHLLRIDKLNREDKSMRDLNNIILSTLSEAEYQLLSNEGKIKQLILTPESVQDPKIIIIK